MSNLLHCHGAALLRARLLPRAVGRGSAYSGLLAVPKGRVIAFTLSHRRGYWTPNSLFNEFNEHAESGNVEAARRLFRELAEHSDPPPPRMAWNTLLKAYSNAGDLDGCVACYQEMKEAGVQANAKTFGKLIEATGKTGRADDAEAWFKEMLAHADKDPKMKVEAIAYSMVIDACGKAGEPERAAGIDVEPQSEVTKGYNK